MPMCVFFVVGLGFFPVVGRSRVWHQVPWAGGALAVLGCAQQARLLPGIFRCILREPGMLRAHGTELVH